MKPVSLVQADTLKGWDTEKQIGFLTGKWVVCRPIGSCGLFWRLRLALAVFRGKYDALEWHQQ